MRVLVACEESQRVCTAFRERGHEAYSCDILPCSGGHQEWHIQGDALKIIGGGSFVTMDGAEHFVEKWDLLIAHPPCTYISNAGARFLYPKGKLNEDRLRKGIEATHFFLRLLWADVDHRRRRKSRTVNCLLSSKLYAVDTTVAIWTPGTEENMPVVEKSAEAKADGYLRRTAEQQGCW